MADIHENYNNEDEQIYYNKVIQSFKSYGDYCMMKVEKSIKYYNELNQKQKDLIPNFKANCEQLIKCINHNNNIIYEIINSSEHVFQNQADTLSVNETNENKSIKLKIVDIDRIISSLKQIVRDWTSFGINERSKSYSILIDDLIELYPSANFNYNEISCLVPGSGLGRLAFEIARLGFICQGNEFSLEMLIISNFILNKCKKENMYEIYPWINQWSNNVQFNDQIRSVTFPDVSPFDLEENSQFSMVAGDFLEVYNREYEFNVVVTCYFIDTARNIIEYLEKIFLILCDGGYWINFGPLLYHFSDSINDKSIELTYEQLKYAIEKIGFIFIKEEINIESTYNENKLSMLNYTYKCIHFVVQKPFK